MLKKELLKIILVFLTSFWLLNASAEVMVIQPVSAILKQMRMQGYIAISKIELLKDEYQILALDKDGKHVAIRVNPHTGEMISMVKRDSYMSMADAVDKVESIGYSNFSLVEAEGDLYKVIALSPNGSKTQLTIDATTGYINKMGEKNDKI
jgi:uncharacterized membrane protein YkoI